MRLIDGDALYDEIHGGQLSALGFEGYDDYTNINNIDDALDAVKYAPTVNQWIPCSEQMPPVGKTVIVTVKTENDIWTDYDTWYQEGWMAYIGNDREVIAWTRFEPYKGVTE